MHGSVPPVLFCFMTWSLTKYRDNYILEHTSWATDQPFIWALHPKYLQSISSTLHDMKDQCHCR